ncbi:hypothetical protein LguiA_001676 [Lonicera macranthoides]
MDGGEMTELGILLIMRRRILIFSRSRDHLDSCFSLPCINKEDASVQSIPQPWDGEYNHILYDLLGSCNGFVLIGQGRTILLWNPSTRASREVLRHENLLHCYNEMCAMTGLCYDSSTNDYKVILQFVGLPGKPFEFSSLRKKCWTRVDDDDSSNYLAILGRNKGAVVNGNQHWLVKKKLKNEKDEDKNKFEEAIIYFDRGSEKLNEIPIPIMLATGGGGGGYCYGLGELDGCLALGRQSDGGTTIEILVMKDYNVQEELSWTLCFTYPVYIGPHYRFNLAMQPLCITKDGAGGEVLMVKDRQKIVAYSPKKEEYRRIHIVPSAFCSISMEVAEYVESLVSPSAATRPDLMER